MREIKKKPTPIQPLDIRLRALLSLISGNDARTIDHLVKIVAKPSLSAQDLTDLKKDLLKLKPIYTDCKVWEKALTEIAVDLRRDKRTLKRLLGPVRAKRNHKPMDSLRPGSVESTASLQAADQSVTS